MWMEKKLRQHKLHKLLHFVRFSLKSYECYHMVELCAHSWTLYFFAIFLKHLSQPMMISLVSRLWLRFMPKYFSIVVRMVKVNYFFRSL